MQLEDVLDSKQFALSRSVPLNAGDIPKRKI
jgi:hypothetical protein